MGRRPLISAKAALPSAWIACALLSGGCSPSLDWREVHPDGSGAIAMFPCRPSHEKRDVPLAGRVSPVTIDACRAGGVMYALSVSEASEPARVGEVLDALAASAIANIGGVVHGESLSRIEGMTPHPRARLLEIAGRLPDGRPVQERVAVFARGTRVYQATMLGERLAPDAAESFLGGLRLR